MTSTETALIEPAPAADKNEPWKHYTEKEIALLSKLAARGRSAPVIAEVFGLTTRELRAACRYHGVRLRGSAGRGELSAKFGRGETADIFRREATARGTTVAQLGARLLETIARDNMFAAVLDDDGHA